MVLGCVLGVVSCGEALDPGSWGGSEGKSTRAPTQPKFALLAWNDLGMHCYNPDFQDLAVLPPYNTLWAQVVRIHDPPQIITEGVIVKYRILDNTYSAGKTNFWIYAQQLFGLSQPLPLDIGLKGKGLSGTMDPQGNHFIAEGIPLTEYRDSAPTTPDPYQVAVLTAESIESGEVLCSLTVVTPVSSELSCDNCHLDNGDATTRYPITPTGKVDTNILALHDYLNPAAYDPPLMERRPVLCAECHASNALGAPGAPGVSSLSNAMHRHHKDLPDITPDTDGCYKCHPGARTKCLRDVMSQTYALNCTTCHGDMTAVSQNTDPWLLEPRCDSASCHGAGYQLDQALYRHSRGHGGTYCAGCHDSPHAIASSREPLDGAKFETLQGSPGTLKSCTVCHATEPTNPFVHRWVPPAP
jgi:hypothetical protein